MLKKEISDSLKIFGECLLLLLAVPLAYVFDKLVIHFGWTFSEIFIFIYTATIIIYPIAAGMTLFQSEKKDRTFEYLFSLPLSRLKIITHKILPRLSLLLLLIIVSSFISVFRYPWQNGFNLIVLFLISSALSLAISSFAIGVIGASLFFFVYFQTSRIMYMMFCKWNINTYEPFSKAAFLSSLLTAALFLTPLGAAFWVTFLRFDVKPLKWQLKTYFFIVLSSVAIFVTFIIKFQSKYMSAFYGR
jgi:ABC-type Na+ efflux pump permease subunit